MAVSLALPPLPPMVAASGSESPLVAVVMGSDSDLPTMQPAV